MPLSRGALYRRVVEDLLIADDARGLGEENRARLSELWM